MYGPGKLSRAPQMGKQHSMEEPGRKPSNTRVRAGMTILIHVILDKQSSSLPTGHLTL